MAVVVAMIVMMFMRMHVFMVMPMFVRMLSFMPLFLPMFAFLFLGYFVCLMAMPAVAAHADRLLKNEFQILLSKFIVHSKSSNATDPRRFVQRQ